MIEVLETGGLNTVQDLGRFGFRHLGVGCSGAMDTLALRAGNILLGNDEGAAAIELQTFPAMLRFGQPCRFVVSGADTSPLLDDRPVLPWFVAEAAAGQMLSVSPPKRGARAYLCVSGGIDVPIVLGSRSTQMRGGFGGVEGRPLRAGDRLAIGSATGTPSPVDMGAMPPVLALRRVAEPPDGITEVRAIPATDHHRFDTASRDRFWHAEWRITPQSDRVGYRLSGNPLSLVEPLELRSYGIVPGIVQVPPAGEPIVQMADANTAGGYPRMACVIEADLWRLAQARIGSRVRFRRCDHAEGVAAMRAVEAWRDDLALMCTQYRQSHARRIGVQA